MQNVLSILQLWGKTIHICDPELFADIIPVEHNDSFKKVFF